MILSDIQRDLDKQRSLANSFPGQVMGFDQFGGENQRAAIQVQLESAKMLADQHEKLDRMSEALMFLAEHAQQSQISSRERQAIEDKRHLENLRFTKIAAWSGVVAAILGIVAIVFR